MRQYSGRLFARIGGFFLLALPVGLPPRAQAQTALGVEAGAVTAYSDALIQVGIRVGPTRGGYGAPDVAFATFPDALASGVAVLLIDADAAFGLPSEPDAQAVFLPRGGLSVFAGNTAHIGFNLGIGVLAKVNPKLGLRIDYTHRRFFENGGSYPLSSITVGLIFLR